jgi:hypothetical protein
VYDISLFIPEGICFTAFVAFVACCYSMQFLIQQQQNARPTTIKMHADGNLTSKVIGGTKLKINYIWG